MEVLRVRTRHLSGPAMGLAGLILALGGLSKPASTAAQARGETFDPRDLSGIWEMSMLYTRKGPETFPSSRFVPDVSLSGEEDAPTSFSGLSS